VIIDDMFYKAKFTFNAHALLVKKSFILNIIDELEKREFENDVIFAYMQSKGIGNWYGLIEDSIIQHGKYNKSFITTLSESCFDKVGKLNGDFNIQIITDKLFGVYKFDPDIKLYRESKKNLIIQNGQV
jgi:hypothetical protein